MANEVVTRTHRIVGVVAGAFFGLNVAAMGVFLDLLAVTVSPDCSWPVGRRCSSLR